MIALPAFLQQPQLQGLVTSYPINTNYIGSRWFPEQPVASDELLINIEVPEAPIAPFITIDQEAPRDQREILTQMRTTLAYIRFKAVFQESELRIFGLRDSDNNNGLIGQMQSEAQAKILRHIARLRQAVDARLEWMRMNALTGQIAYDDQRIKFAVNFPGIYTGGGTAFTKWDQAGANPLADISRWQEEMSDVTGENFEVVLGSPKIFRQLANVTNFQELALFRAGGTATQITPTIARALLTDFTGLEFVDYAAKISSRSYDSAGVPAVVRQDILNPKYIVLLPKGPVGNLATSPNPIDFGGTGVYSWTQNHQDPWVIETGVGINAFPDMKWPEKIGYIQVLT